MVRLKDYIALEEGVADWLYSMWRAKAQPVMPEAEKAANAGDFDTVIRLLRGIDVQSIAQAADAGLDNHVVTSLTFGAMLAKGSSQIMYIDQPLPPVVTPVKSVYLAALRNLPEQAIAALTSIEKADTGPSQAHQAHEHCDHYHPTPVVIMKAKGLTNAQKLNAVVMGQAKAAIDIAANLNTSRLVSLGFLDQQLDMGVEFYQHTAVLDGRVCGVCQTLHGKVFSTATARSQVLNLLMLSDPDAVKAAAPFPSQSKASIAAMRNMQPEQLQSAGFAHVPVHPGCRCRQVKVGTVPANQILPVGPIDQAQLPDVPLPLPSAVEALSDKTLSATMKAAKDKLSERLTDKQIVALDKLFNEPLVNKWTRTCWGKTLVQKGESDFSFCSAFDPKKMGQLIKNADEGVTAWEFDSDTTLTRYAAGAFGKELRNLWDHLNHSILHDKGFVTFDGLNAAVGTDFSDMVAIKIKVQKGQKGVKIGDDFSLPVSSKLHIKSTKITDAGQYLIEAELVDGPTDVPWWWLKEGGEQTVENWVHLKAQGWTEKAIWDDLQEYKSDMNPGYAKEPFPFGPKATPETFIVAEPETVKIVPAGTADAEKTKKLLGDDFLDYASLTYHSPKPGGSIPGETMTDITGQKWIVKHVSNEEIARNEVLAGKLYEAMGVEVPELRLVKGPSGQTWVASKWVDGFETVPSRLQSKERLPGLYDNFVADAFMSNWDVVGASYDNIGLLNGRAYRIDVGGALRFRAQGGVKSEDMFPDQVIDLDNMRNPSISPLVAKVFADITESELRAGALKVMSLSDDKLSKIISTYGPTSIKDRAQLLGKMKARRDDIAKRFPTADTPPVLNQSPPVVEATARVTKTEWDGVVEARVSGKAFITDADQIEGQNVLLHIETDANGQQWTVATLKLRGDKATELEARAERSLGPSSTTGNPVEPLMASLDQRVLEFVKGLAKQRDSSGVLRSTELDRLAKAKAALAQVRATLLTDSFDVSDAADTLRYYDDYLKLFDGLNMEGQDISTFSFPLFAPRPVPRMLAPAPTSNEIWTRIDGSGWNLKKLENGFASETGKFNSFYGTTYRLETASSRVDFIPKSSGVHSTALHNQLTIRVKGASQTSAAKVFDELELLGINADRASDLDQKFLYLNEMAYLDRDLWQKASRITAGASPLPAKVADLEQLVTQHFGVSGSDIDANFRSKRQAFDQGNTYRERVDLNGPEWEKFKSKYRLTHDNTSNWMSMPELLDAVLNSGGRMVTSVEKKRLGLPLDGMSANADMRTGGANYFFTRIADAQKAGGRSNRFIFKVDSIRRTDTISYGNDLYGQADSANFIHSNRKTSIRDYRAIAKKHGNETNVKGGLSLFDDLEHVIVDSYQVADIMAVFAKHNLRQWPDGRALSDVVITQDQYRDKLAAQTQPTSAPAPKTKPVVHPVPDWAKLHPDSYQSFKDANMDDSDIKLTFEQNGMLPPPKPLWQQNAAKMVATPQGTVTPAPTPAGYGSFAEAVEEYAADIEKVLPSGLKVWQHGYTSYLKDYEAKGFTPAQIETKVKGLLKGPFMPDWVKASTHPNAKVIYKQMKAEGQPDLIIQMKMAEKGMVDQPPVPIPAYPKWAYGYEKQYDESKATLGESDLKVKIEKISKAAFPYPSWLNLAFKESYKLAKKSGLSDSQIIDKHKDWML